MTSNRKYSDLEIGDVIVGSAHFLESEATYIVVKPEVLTTRYTVPPKVLHRVYGPQMTSYIDQRFKYNKIGVIDQELLKILGLTL